MFTRVRLWTHCPLYGFCQAQVQEQINMYCCMNHCAELLDWQMLVRKMVLVEIDRIGKEKSSLVRCDIANVDCVGLKDTTAYTMFSQASSSLTLPCRRPWLEVIGNLSRQYCVQFFNYHGLFISQRKSYQRSSHGSSRRSPLFAAMHLKHPPTPFASVHFCLDDPPKTRTGYSIH